MSFAVRLPTPSTPPCLCASVFSSLQRPQFSRVLNDMTPRLLIFLATIFTLSTPATTPLKQGDTFTLNSQTYTLTQLDSLPYVDSDYSRRFRFDRHDNPKLKELRETYDLEEVVAPGR